MKKVLTSLTKFLFYLFSFLPFQVLYFISDIIFLFLYYVTGYRRVVVQTNLKNSFPEKSAKELAALEKGFYHHLCDMMVEGVKMATLSKADLQKRYKLKNPQLIQHFLDQKKPVMLITGHYGNWEWGALALSAAFRDPVIVVYKPISDKGFEKLMNTIRSRFGAVMVAMKKTLRVLVSYKGQPHLAVFVGDQTPVKSEATFFTDFLNQRTAFFLGTEKLAKALGAPVVFGHVTKTKRGYYESEFTLICDSAAETAQYEITSKHIALLEDKINKRPELWLWSHKRWKFKEEDTVE